MEEKEISMREIILKTKEVSLYVLRKWLIIFIIGVLGALLGLLYAYGDKYQYTARLVFALEDDKGGGGGGGLSNLASQFGFDMGSSAGGAFAGANLIELLKSRSLVEKTLLNPVVVNGSEISLAEFYIQFNGWRERWKDAKDPAVALVRYLPNEDRRTYSRTKDSILGVIYEKLITDNLDVAQSDKKVSFVNIQVISTNEQFSKTLTENIAKEASEFYVETKSKKAKTNVAIIQRQVDSVRRELNAAISGVAVVNDNTFNLNPALNVKRIGSSTRQVDVQANTAILTELVKNLEMAKVTLLKETPFLQVIDRPILPLPKKRLSKLKSMEIGALCAGALALIVLLIYRWWALNISATPNREKVR